MAASSATKPDVPTAAAPAQTPTTLPKVALYDLPLHDLAEVAKGSGLQWVNSNASKIAEAKAAIAAEVKPVHIPRERPAMATASDAALVLVETKRDLRGVTLPFEKPAG